MASNFLPLLGLQPITQEKLHIMQFQFRGIFQRKTKRLW